MIGRGGRVAAVVSLVAVAGCRRSDGRPASQPLPDPSRIVFRSADGRALTIDDLEGATGTFKYEIVGDVGVPDEARALHRRGRQAGGSRDYKTAIALFTKAAELAPRWPYPIYDRAYTYLLMKDFEAARTDYLATVSIAPRGYFTAITSADLLVREKKKELPEGTCLAYLMLEWVEDPVEKENELRQLVARVPRLAPAWEDLAYLTDDTTKKLALIEKGLAAQPDAETRGMLQINKALALQDSDHAAAVRLLGDVVLDLKSTVGNVERAKASLALLAQEPKN